MTTWLLIFAMGLVSYATRAMPLLFPWRRSHPMLERTLRYLPPAVLAALILTSLMAPSAGGAAAGSTLGGAVVGATIAWRTRSVPLTVASGLAAFWLVGTVAPP